MELICVAGNLGRDPESRKHNDSVVTDFSVAVAAGRDETRWYKVSIWGKQAEACKKFLQKGSKVVAYGTLDVEEYTDKQGKERYSLCVKAQKVEFMNSKNDAPEQKPTPTDASIDSIPF